MERKKLTRIEMWYAITSKHPALKAFKINCPFNQWSGYVKREYIFKLLVDLNIHKSRHLKKAQKQKIINELNEIIIGTL